MEAPNHLVGPAVRPWFTAALTLLALVATAFPTFAQALVYERTLIARGEAWRLWTGHLTHLSVSHLIWNLIVFVPAGLWLERLRPGLARVFLAVGPIFISGVLFFADRDLERYSGLSGVAVGLVVLLALVQLRRADEPSWVWISVLVIVALKVATEFTGGGTALFAGLPIGTHNVPLAHAAGAVAALLMVGWPRRAAAPEGSH
jgi:rhomboid family GlyGly-CTERM serine protease